MRNFNDTTSDIDEKASERMNFRTKPHIKKAIQRAAALSGVDDSAFTMSAAYASALKTIASHERTALKPIDHEVFFEALDHPPKPTRKLREAVKRYRERVVSR
jgi:uncharacterized protein (DUF1778 family)